MILAHVDHKSFEVYGLNSSEVLSGQKINLFFPESENDLYTQEYLVSSVEKNGFLHATLFPINIGLPVHGKTYMARPAAH